MPRRRPRRARSTVGRWRSGHPGSGHWLQAFTADLSLTAARPLRLPRTHTHPSQQPHNAQDASEMLVALPKSRSFWKLLPRRPSPAPLAVSHGLPALEAFRRNHGSFTGALFGKRPHGTWLSQAKTFNCAFCIAADQDLISKKCVPCNSKDIRSMSEQSARELLPQVEGWVMVNDNGVLKLHRSWKVKSFTKGLEFLQHVADVAEAEGHHPDLHLVGWNNVKIDIWTHAVGGLTENDFILAAKIGSLDLEQLLRRKAGEAGTTM